MANILLDVFYFGLCCMTEYIWENWLHPQEKSIFSSPHSHGDGSSSITAPLQLVDQITHSQEIFPILFVTVL